jgi:hypothetical protein
LATPKASPLLPMLTAAVPQPRPGQVILSPEPAFREISFHVSISSWSVRREDESPSRDRSCGHSRPGRHPTEEGLIVMAIFLRALLASVALLILETSAWTQEPPKPTQQHDHLKRLVGAWDAETASGTGTMTYKMGLGGLWLIGDFEGEFGGMKFHGKGLDTYDAGTKKYRSVWVDSFSAAPRIMEGSLDKEGKVMTMHGKGPGAGDKPAKYKSITEIKDADTVNFGLFMVEKDGKEQPLVNITYKRKK